MKAVARRLRPESGLLALSLLLLLPILRAEDVPATGSPQPKAGTTPAPGDPPAAKEQSNPAAAAQLMEEARLKLMLAKYDANRDGKLDAGEKDRMKADLEIWAKKYQETLAKYDANHNGALDPEEKAKMQKDQAAADRAERRLWSSQAQQQQKAQQRQNQLARPQLQPSMQNGRR